LNQSRAAAFPVSGSPGDALRQFRGTHPCAAPIPGSATSTDHPNTSCPVTPSPAKRSASLGSPQHSLAAGCFLSCVQPRAGTPEPATALAQQLWNYVCRPPGHHLHPCHWGLFVSCHALCQVLLHQPLSWDCLSTISLSCLLLEIDGMVKMRHNPTFHPQLSVLEVSYTVCEPLRLLSTAPMRQFPMCITEPRVWSEQTHMSG